jgi:polysaccharide biosynthesis protein PslH
MRILQVCKKFPFPLKEGEAIVVNHLSNALVDLGCEVTLLSMNTSKHPYEIKEIPEKLSHYKEIHSVELNNDVSFIGAFTNLFSSQSYHVSRFLCSKFENKLIDLLVKNKYDAILLETVILSPYIETIRKWSNAAVILRSHNVEHEIWERVSGNQGISFLRRAYLKIATRKLKTFEISALNEPDFFVAISERDLGVFKSLGLSKSGIVLPGGLDTSEYVSDFFPIERKSVGFIGALDWIPNLEGLDWFLENVWPEVHALHPDAIFEVAGRNMPENLKAREIKGVKFLGEVKSSKEFMNSHPMIVAPILSGSGIRVKILEAMSLARVVVTTSVGLEGISAHHPTEVFIADTASSMIKSIDICFSHPQRMKEMGLKARKLMEDHYDIHLLTKKFITTLQKKIEFSKKLDVKGIEL